MQENDWVKEKLSCGYHLFPQPEACLSKEHFHQLSGCLLSFREFVEAGQGGACL